MDIGGEFYTVVQNLPGSSAIIVASGAGLQAALNTGDTVNLYAAGTLQPLGSATVSATPFTVTGPSIPPNTVDSELFAGTKILNYETFWQVRLPCAQGQCHPWQLHRLFDDSGNMDLSNLAASSGPFDTIPQQLCISTIQ